MSRRSRMRSWVSYEELPKYGSRRRFVPSLRLWTSHSLVQVQVMCGAQQITVELQPAEAFAISDALAEEAEVALSRLAQSVHRRFPSLAKP
jgi:hypothetical protein